MAFRKLNIGNINITFVFRHKWDDKTTFNTLFNQYRIGFWFKKNKIVGKKMINNPNEWGKNLVNSYMIGIDIIICKLWIEFDINGMSFEI